MKNSYGCILVKPQLGENIGATARVLKNFGFNKLCITSPRDGWPNQKAKATSVGAEILLKKLKCLKTLRRQLKNLTSFFHLAQEKGILIKVI